MLDLLVGGEPLFAGKALAPTADRGPLLGGPGIDDLVILTAAFGTAHILGVAINRLWPSVR
jgi:hypothetical protein